jgi:hypothetical protein
MLALMTWTGGSITAGFRTKALRAACAAKPRPFKLRARTAHSASAQRERSLRALCHLTRRARQAFISRTCGSSKHHAPAVAVSDACEPIGCPSYLPNRACRLRPRGSYRLLGSCRSGSQRITAASTINAFPSPLVLAAGSARSVEAFDLATLQVCSGGIWLMAAGGLGGLWAGKREQQSHYRFGLWGTPWCGQ